MMGHSATSAMRNTEGATMNAARRRSGIPRERRFCGVWARTEAASMDLEGRQRLVHLRLRLLQRLLGRRPARERLVDVLVDRLRDLRVDRRDRAGLRLRDRVAQLRGEVVLLLDLRVVVDRLQRRRLRGEQELALLVLLAGDV